MYLQVLSIILDPLYIYKNRNYSAILKIVQPLYGRKFANMAQNPIQSVKKAEDFSYMSFLCP